VRFTPLVATCRRRPCPRWGSTSRAWKKSQTARQTVLRTQRSAIPVPPDVWLNHAVCGDQGGCGGGAILAPRRNLSAKAMPLLGQYFSRLGKGRRAQGCPQRRESWTPGSSSLQISRFSGDRNRGRDAVHGPVPSRATVGDFGSRRRDGGRRLCPVMAVLLASAKPFGVSI
jgi:hypothetical protein